MIHFTRFACGAFLLGMSVAAQVQAQCPNANCSPKTDNWVFEGYDISQADTIYVGMWKVNTNYWLATICADGVPYTWNDQIYTTNQLVADTSFCAGAGNDDVFLVGAGDWVQCGGIVKIESVYSGGYDFTMSGDQGNDTLCTSGELTTYFYSGVFNTCGGYGGDLQYGGLGNDYSSGGNNNDYMEGRWGSDNVRGGNGLDHVLHFWGGVDKLRGEDDSDCLEWGLAFESSISSCGAGSDYYQKEYGSAVPASCETNGCSAWP